MSGGHLVLFDIDATLITTGGVGKAAMLDAGRELHGPGFTIDGISFAGRLDPMLLEEMLILNGKPCDAGCVEAMFHRYRRVLEGHLKRPIRGGALPGATALVADLRKKEGVVLGLLTGNFRETGSMKLRACGIDPDHFPVQVWGSDSPHSPPSRDHLPAVGMARYKAAFGRVVPPDRVTIIGDTPLDVRCARANGCRSLGVATGQYGVADLLDAGADHAVVNMAETAAISEWLLGGRPVA
jgi:phosphoglycolate phosphatase-like HAD superfamily hydrolase